jgi:hypothetical protein
MGNGLGLRQLELAFGFVSEWFAVVEDLFELEEGGEGLVGLDRHVGPDFFWEGFFWH